MPVVMRAVGRPASYEGYPSGGKTRFFFLVSFRFPWSDAVVSFGISVQSARERSEIFGMN